MNYPYQYVALSMDGEKTAEGGSEIGIKMDGSVPFTIDGWIRTSESFAQKRIIAKKGVFSMGVDGEKLFVHIEGYPTVMASASNGSVVAGEWTHVCAVYSNSAVFLYINGVSNIYASIGGSGQDNGEPFLFGEGFCGLVRQVRIFNCALDSDQVNRYMMQTDLSDQDFKDKLAAYFDFSQVPAVERVGGLPITLPEASMQQAVSQGALFYSNSFLTIDREHNINPAGGGNDSYTVQGWVFLEPDREAGRYTIFANGDINDRAGMSLYIEEEDGKYHARALRASGQDEDTILSSASEIPERQWVNIAVTYSVDTMKLYVDGALDATITGLFPISTLLPVPHLRIGSEVVENNPGGQDWFSGSISRLDIWRRELSAEEIKQYAQGTPDAGLKGLLASYSFHLLDGGNACTGSIIGERNELRFGEVFAPVSQNQQIRETGDAGGAWEEPLTKEQLEQFRREAFGEGNGTPAAFTVTSHRIGDKVYFVAHDRASSYTICQADANDIDPLTQWYIELLLIIVGGVISILFGVSVKASSSRLTAILLRFCQNPQLRSLFAEVITPATIFQVFKLLMSTGTLVDMLRALLSEFSWWKVAWMVAKVCILAAASWAGGWVYYAATLGVLAAEVLEHWKKYADYVSDMGLSSVRFHHMLQGDATVSLQIKKNTPVYVPEWTSTNRSRSHAAYRIDALSGHANVIVQASFQSSANDKFSRDVRCVDRSKEKLFGDSQTVNVSMAKGSSAPYYVSFTFPNHKLASLGVGVSEVKLCWQQKDINGNWKDILETTHKIYRILQTPYAPWDKEAPWVKVLERACTWANGETTKEGVASKIVQQVNKNLGLKYDAHNGRAHYINMFNGNFLLSHFLSHLDGVPYSNVVNCTDCATICATFANAIGCSLSEKQMRDTDNDLGFDCNKVISIGFPSWEVPFPSGFSYHEVCMMEPLQGKGSVVNKNEYKVYDACLMVDGSTNPDSDIGRIAQLPLGMQFSQFNDGDTPDKIPSMESYREHLAKNTDDGVGRCRYDTGYNDVPDLPYKPVE